MNLSECHAQQQDEQERQEAAMEALREARLLGLTEDKLMTLAFECGVVNEFYRYTHNLKGT